MWKFDINVILSGAVMMSGITHSALISMMNCIKCPFLGGSSFYKCLKLCIYPVIAEKWKSMRDSIIKSYGSDPRDTCGDGHFDSPGWTAKYCTYSI